MRITFSDDLESVAKGLNPGRWNVSSILPVILTGEADFAVRGIRLPISREKQGESERFLSDEVRLGWGQGHGSRVMHRKDEEGRMPL